MHGHPRRRTIVSAEKGAESMAGTQFDAGQQQRQHVSGWAVGGIVFAATILTLNGAFQVIGGLVAILDDEFFVVTRHYTYHLDVTAWGWIHLIVGILMLITGLGLFGRRTWAGVAGIMLAMLSALANFFFIPYYPIWSLVVIGLDIWVIWALTRPGAIET
jgi:hypothetical protein